MKVIFNPSVEDFLFDLVKTLYQKEYFGLYESADNYVTDLVHDIVCSISEMPCKIAPSYFNKYGKYMSYAVFKKNKQTQWYVFFNCENDIYYIRYIGNNHTCAQHL